MLEGNGVTPVITIVKNPQANFMEQVHQKLRNCILSILKSINLMNKTLGQIFYRDELGQYALQFTLYLMQHQHR